MNFHAPVSGDRPLDLPLVFGHFVPWYTIRGNDYPLPAEERALLEFMPLIEDYRHWNDSRAGYLRTNHHVPAIGLYDSRDPGVIEWQIRTALEYGVSGFIVNWYGKYSAENVITLHWLRGLTRWNAEHPDQPFYYFLSVDSQAQMASEGKKPVDMEEDFGYIREVLMTGAYLRRDGRPVFMVFPYEDNAPRWRKALDSVFGAGGADLIWSGAARGRGENACYAWVRPDDGTIDFNNAYVWSQPDNAGDGFLRRFFSDANADGSSAEYIMAGVWPGFNDQLVSWAWNPNPDNPKIRPRVICRETTRGNTLELTWKAYHDYLALGRAGDAAARIPAPLVQLVTWNDYAETTTLEPTRDYGSAPLKMCRQFLAEARKRWAPFSERR
jgi:hypothetical protein